VDGNDVIIARSGEVEEIVIQLDIVSADPDTETVWLGLYLANETNHRKFIKYKYLNSRSGEVRFPITQTGEYLVRIFSTKNNYVPLAKSNSVVIYVIPKNENGTETLITDPIFYVSIDVSLQNASKYGKIHFFFKALEYLEKYASTTEGLFRLSGAKVKVDTIRQICDSEKEIDFSAFSDHDVASAVKMFLRDLPEPLIPNDLYNSWICLAAIEDKEKKIINAASLIITLPTANKQVLMALLCYLNKFCAGSISHKMTPQNCAIVLAPSILKAPGDNPLQILASLNVTQQIMNFLISEYIEIEKSITFAS